MSPNLQAGLLAPTSLPPLAGGDPVATLTAEHVVRSLAYPDPHLAVLSVLVALWAVDKLLAAFEALGAARADDHEDASASA